MSEQLVPAIAVVEQYTQPGSRFVCVGLDALSAADELVEGVSLDLQQVIAKLKQAAHVNYTSGVKFGTENKAVLYTYIQVVTLLCIAYMLCMYACADTWYEASIEAIYMLRASMYIVFPAYRGRSTYFLFIESHHKV